MEEEEDLREEGGGGERSSGISQSPNVSEGTTDAEIPCPCPCCFLTSSSLKVTSLAKCVNDSVAEERKEEKEDQVDWELVTRFCLTEDQSVVWTLEEMSVVPVWIFSAAIWASSCVLAAAVEVIALIAPHELPRSALHSESEEEEFEGLGVKFPMPP